eukprot:CAMPEP_0168818904 /NCGR_PEP_ID=MMETSP0726-20121227/8003_1 /TAXON_ID=265536 /ORGANISM="Amphiprora sp., Strain CCMP467" /LENGTH=114 /DNA_ID=CAMNT_0008871257 /DNA_START=19 /DNA_END=360 /DNA_ORIENTATION=-
MGDYSTQLKVAQDADHNEYGYEDIRPDETDEQREARNKRMMMSGRKSSILQISTQALMSGRNNLRASISNKALGGNREGRSKARFRRIVIAITMLMGSSAIILSGYFFFVQGGD